jgi:hypothetical protein
VIVAGSAAAAADLDFEAGHSIEVSWRRYHQRSCRKSAAPRASSSSRIMSIG